MTIPTDFDFEWLPDWALARTDTWCLGAQLATKDGRRLGNAVITDNHPDAKSPWEVVTDAGNTLRLTTAELGELFYTPQWVMNVSTAPGVLARTALAQPETPSRLHYCSTHGQQPKNAWGCPECVREMRQQLAQPEPEGPISESELAAMWNQQADAFNQWESLDSGEQLAWAQARAIARYARPTIEPVPVSERLPGPEDCDAEGRCWWFSPPACGPHKIRPCWTLDSELMEGDTHWLPHHAFPIPTPLDTRTNGLSQPSNCQAPSQWSQAGAKR